MANAWSGKKGKAWQPQDFFPIDVQPLPQSAIDFKVRSLVAAFGGKVKPKNG